MKKEVLKRILMLILVTNFFLVFSIGVINTAADTPPVLVDMFLIILRNYSRKVPSAVLGQPFAMFHNAVSNVDRAFYTDKKFYTSVDMDYIRWTSAFFCLNPDYNFSDDNQRYCAAVIAEFFQEVLDIAKRAEFSTIDLNIILSYNDYTLLDEAVADVTLKLQELAEDSDNGSGHTSGSGGSSHGGGRTGGGFSSYVSRGSSREPSAVGFVVKNVNNTIEINGVTYTTITNKRFSTDFLNQIAVPRDSTTTAREATRLVPYFVHNDDLYVQLGDYATFSQFRTNATSPNFSNPTTAHVGMTFREHLHTDGRYYLSFFPNMFSINNLSNARTASGANLIAGVPLHIDPSGLNAGHNTVFPLFDVGIDYSRNKGMVLSLNGFNVLPYGGGRSEYYFSSPSLVSHNPPNGEAVVGTSIFIANNYLNVRTTDVVNIMDFPSADINLFIADQKDDGTTLENVLLKDFENFQETEDNTTIPLPIIIIIINKAIDEGILDEEPDVEMDEDGELTRIGDMDADEFFDRMADLFPELPQKDDDKDDKKDDKDDKDKDKDSDDDSDDDDDDDDDGFNFYFHPDFHFGVPELIPGFPAITDRFPFSLPKDYMYLVNLFAVEPEPPIFSYRLKIGTKDSIFHIDREIKIDPTIFRVGRRDIIQTATNFACVTLLSLALVKATFKIIPIGGIL